MAGHVTVYRTVTRVKSGTAPVVKCGNEEPKGLRRQPLRFVGQPFKSNPSPLMCALTVIFLSNGIVCDSNRQKGVLFTREMLRRDILSTPATCIVDQFLEVPPSYPSASRTALRSDKNRCREMNLNKQ